MTDLHVKGAASTAEGTAKEAAGKLTGDRTLEAEGRIKKVEGKTQEGLADAHDAVRRAERA